MAMDVLCFDIGNGKKSLGNHYCRYIDYGNVEKWLFGDGAAVLYGLCLCDSGLWCCWVYVVKVKRSKETYDKEAYGHGLYGKRVNVQTVYWIGVYDGNKTIEKHMIENKMIKKVVVIKQLVIEKKLIEKVV
eukprot:258264_1